MFYIHSDYHKFYHRSPVRNISDHIFSQTLTPHSFGINCSGDQHAVFILFSTFSILKFKYNENQALNCTGFINLCYRFSSKEKKTI